MPFGPGSNERSAILENSYKSQRTMAEEEVRSILMPLKPKNYCLTPIMQWSTFNFFFSPMYFFCQIFLKDIRTEARFRSFRFILAYLKESNAAAHSVDSDIFQSSDSSICALQDLTWPLFLKALSNRGESVLVCINFMRDETSMASCDKGSWQKITL